MFTCRFIHLFAYLFLFVCFILFQNWNRGDGGRSEHPVMEFNDWINGFFFSDATKDHFRERLALLLKLATAAMVETTVMMVLSITTSSTSTNTTSSTCISNVHTLSSSFTNYLLPSSSSPPSVGSGSQVLIICSHTSAIW